MSSSIKRVGCAVAAASALTLLVAACSSSSKSSGAGASSSSAAPAGSGSSSAQAASGTPILIGGAAPINSAVYTEPDAKVGLESAVASINAAGGVAGHPLKVDFCDTQYTVNGELACARQFVSDKVVAVLDPIFLADQSGAEDTLLEKAGIPIFGTQGLSPAELNSPDVYPLSSGLPGWAYGAADQILKAGATKVSILVDTNPASEFGGTLVAAALKLAGKTPAATVIGDATSDPTFATAAAKATANGVDGVVMFPDPADLPKMIVALKQSGYTGKIGTLTVILPPVSIKALGSAADGVLADSQTALTSDTSNPGVAKFIADVKTQADITDAAVTAWSAAEIFAKAIAGASSFDAAGVSAALKNVTTPIDIGTVGPWQSSGVSSPLSGYSRILNPTITYGVVKNGVLTPDGQGFVNPFTSLAAGK
jgi:ABC-type branched-subunit amino acid transport system substrate-binding protein